MAGIKGKSGKYKKTEEHRQKISINRQGKKHTEETKKKISKKRLERKEELGYINSLKTRKKISSSKKGKKQSRESIEKRREKMKGHIVTEETREKIGKANKGKISKRKGKKLSKEHIKNIRLGKIKYIQYCLNNELPISPTIGKNENKILNQIEEILECEILRQYEIDGYFVDGYCKELNLVIEVDEKHHFDNNGNLKERDIERQKNIEKELNCNFIRIKDI